MATQSTSRKWVFVGVGALLVVVGVIWMLQGFDVLGGSAMSGSTMWAVIGPIVALVGLALVVIGFGRRAGAAPRR